MWVINYIDDEGIDNLEGVDHGFYFIAVPHIIDRSVAAHDIAQIHCDPLVHEYGV